MVLTSSQQDWLKGVYGLGIVKDAFILLIEQHYQQKAAVYSMGDNHLPHLLNLAVKGEVKQTKKEGSFWKISCSDCRPILKDIEESHNRPARLKWINNDEWDNCPEDFRLARLYMPGGIENIQNFRGLDALTVLEILKNDKGFCAVYDDISYLILFRNRLMHSSSNCIKEGELDEAFAKMKHLLESDKFKKLPKCISAVTELDKLKKEKMMEKIEESNENWKLALEIQKQANIEAGTKTLSPEALKILLEEMQADLETEKDEREKVQSQLLNAKSQHQGYQKELSEAHKERSHLIKLLKEKEDILKDLKIRSDTAYSEYFGERTTLHEEINKMKKRLEGGSMSEYMKLIDEKEKLQKEIDDLKTPKTLSGRIIAGGITGSGIGIAGGAVGVMIGGTAGGVVGGLSYLWDLFPSVSK